jgi:hypothetical protein
MIVPSVGIHVPVDIGIADLAIDVGVSGTPVHVAAVHSGTPIHIAAVHAARSVSNGGPGSAAASRNAAAPARPAAHQQNRDHDDNLSHIHLLKIRQLFF